MLDWIHPAHIVDPYNFDNAFQLIKKAIISTHQHPLVECFKDSTYVGTEYLFALQLLHLIAEPTYLPFLCYVMAAYLATQVSNKEHLLVLNPSCDWSGRTDLPQPLISQNQHARELFHNTDVPPRILMQFYFSKQHVLEYINSKTLKKVTKDFYLQRYKHIQDVVMKLIIHHHVENRFRDYVQHQKLNLGKRKIKENIASSASNLMMRIEKKNLKRHWITILRAVADFQNIEVLQVFLAKAKEYWPQKNTEIQIFRHYMTGNSNDSERIIDVLRVALLPC
jgi:hypothetical protein